MKIEGFSKIVVLILLVLICLFSTAVLYIFYETGQEPTTLIITLGGLITSEFGFLAFLRKKEIDSNNAR